MITYIRDREGLINGVDCTCGYQCRSSHSYTDEELPKGFTEHHCPEETKKAAKRLGRRGGDARARNLTKKQLSDIGRKGGKAKRKKRRDVRHGQVILLQI